MTHQNPPDPAAITTYRGVTAAVAHPSLSSALGPAPDGSPLANLLRRQMDLSDAPRHSELRRVVMPAFGRLDRARAVAAQWLSDRLPSLPATFDLVEAVAKPLPMVTVLELIGMPDRLRDRAAASIGRIVAQLEGAAGERDGAAIEELSEVVSSALSETTLEPGCVLDCVRSDGTLTLEDVVANVMLIAAAGHATTTHLIGSSAWWCLRNGDVRTHLEHEPGALPSAIEEVLRFESPVQRVRRRCVSRCEIDGAVFEAGTIVTLLLGAANRDASAFEYPERFDPLRAPNRHLAFGGGPHLCLGAALARMQARLVVGSLLPWARVADDTPDWLPSATFRGLQRLHIKRGD
jgi:cytochrome P450